VEFPELEREKEAGRMRRRIRRLGVLLIFLVVLLFISTTWVCFLFSLSSSSFFCR
jgi:hypothetical protein